jgi:hypothetical protein
LATSAAYGITLRSMLVSVLVKLLKKALALRPSLSNQVTRLPRITSSQSVAPIASAPIDTVAADGQTAVGYLVVALGDVDAARVAH